MMQIGPAISFLAAYFILGAFAEGQTLRKIASFDLPGPGGKRFDYLTIDTADNYLISAHLAANQTYVIDLTTNRVVATVTDTPGAEGVECVPELKKFYTSNAHDNTIGVVDLSQMKVIKKLKTEAKPDGSTYATPFHKLYVSDERGKAEAVVDVSKDEIVKTLHFDSETGMPQYDPVARKVYVNLQDQNLFAVIDPATDEVVARHSVGRCKGNHGMALDPEHHRAFLSARKHPDASKFSLWLSLRFHTALLLFTQRQEGAVLLGWQQVLQHEGRTGNTHEQKDHLYLDRCRRGNGVSLRRCVCSIERA